MKKAVLILTVLVLFSTLAFAMPNVGVGLWGRTQFQLAGGASGTDTQIYQGWGPAPGTDGWNPMYGMEWWFMSETLDFNFKIKIRDTWMENQNMFATLKVLPDLLTVRFGKWTGDGMDTYRRADVTDDQNGNTGRMGGNGIWLTVAPKDTNFSATVFYQTPSFSTWTKRTVMQNAQLTELCAAYTLPDLLKITAGTQTNGDTAGPGGNLVRSVFGRVDLLMVKGLSCFLDVSYDGLEPEADNNATNLNVMLDAYYTMDALTFWVVPKLKMATVKTPASSVMGYNVRAGVNYNLGDVTPALELKLTDDDMANTTMVIHVAPSIQFNKFSTNLSVQIDYTMPSGALSWSVPVYVDCSFW